MTGRLFTLGYAGLRGAADLRDLLAGAAIEVIFDVRLHRSSRNLAFSQGTEATVREAGMDYVYLRDLGNRAYRTGGTEIADIEAIERVLDELRAGRNVALLCACASYRDCHRQDLAWEATRRLPGLRVIHLVRQTDGTARQHPGQRVDLPRVRLRLALLNPQDPSDADVQAFVDWVKAGVYAGRRNRPA